MNERSFRERLLKTEQVTPALKQRYDQEIQAMLEKQLTGIRRWGWLGSAIMGLGFAVLFGTLAVITPAEFPPDCSTSARATPGRTAARQAPPATTLPSTLAKLLPMTFLRSTV